MVKWEYLTVELEKGSQQFEESALFSGKTKVVTKTGWYPIPFTRQLNVFGQEGWELVTIFHEESEAAEGSFGTERFFATFKRSFGG